MGVLPAQALCSYAIDELLGTGNYLIANVDLGLFLRVLSLARKG
jgi:hypothetical protein